MPTIACEKGDKAEKAPRKKKHKKKKKQLRNEVATTAVELRTEMQQQALAPGADSACDIGDKVEKAMEMIAGRDEHLRPSWADIVGGPDARKGKRKGKAPDVPTYNARISACVKDHKAEKAIELFVGLQSTGSEPNVTTYTALISACVKDHEVEKAMELVAEMQQGGWITNVKPSYLETIRSLFSGCSSDRHAEILTEMAMGLFDETRLGPLQGEGPQGV